MNKSRLEELQKICSAKQSQALAHSIEIKNKIIKRDLQILLPQLSNVQNPKPDVYISGNIEFRIVNDILEIIDRRGHSFLWCFEIEFTNVQRLGDAFILGRDCYSVSLLRNVTEERIFLEVENVIREFDSSIKYFNDNPDFRTYGYTYFSEHEELSCQNISEVYNAVINRSFN